MALIDKYTHKAISNIARRYAKPRAKRTELTVSSREPIGVKGVRLWSFTPGAKTNCHPLLDREKPGCNTWLLTMQVG
ncbi:unnamed protein product [marine sediment metagenome]|uniref:Uncharacterized protein n=1 Tax=marine sediment metagenome TaxID=412755 RepID=X1ST53_9ZZZZ